MRDAAERNWVNALNRKDKERPGVTLMDIVGTVVDCQTCLEEMKEEGSVVWKRSLKALAKRMKEQATAFDRRVQGMETMVRREMHDGRIQSHTGGG